nr:uncharacterized protein si:ch211-244b2.3 isoform X1 [Nothobranchius furzeri]
MYFSQIKGNQERFYQNTAASEKPYEWQLLTGNQWQRIDNDHVIETHYCQPGAKGITINTSQGCVSIDFDTLRTNNASLRVQRLSLLSQGQTEDIGWYFRDDHLWCEYGSQSSSSAASSVSSGDVELSFTHDPRGVFGFTVGSTRYSLNFSNMTQQNTVTGVSRKVRRRPKLTLSPAGLYSPPVLQTSLSPQLPHRSFRWEFMGDEGRWTEYQAHVCSFDSAAIETQYQLDPQGQLLFRINNFSYTLDFSRMCQINSNIGTTRAVRRTLSYGVQTNTSSGSRWQFQDIDGTWKEYSKGYSQCSVSSPDIELQYQQNPSGSMTFTTKCFSYELDFSGERWHELVSASTDPIFKGIICNFFLF